MTEDQLRREQEAAERGRKALDEGAWVRASDARPEPFHVPPASTWASRTPPERAWTWRGWIPAGRVTLFMGDGGVGKSITAQTIMTACAAGLGELWGWHIASGVCLGVYSEEEADELERRQRPICRELGVRLEALDDLHILSRYGGDNLLAVYRDGIAIPTEFFDRLEATVATLHPHLLVIDPAADFFAGNPISQGEVRQFIQVILGGLCLRHGCTILLPMHPSAAGIADGSGAGFSVAWSNAARSRLYVERDSAGAGEAQDGRIKITKKKTNYAPVDEAIELAWTDGCFAQLPRGGIVEAIAASNARKAVLRLLAECEAIPRLVYSSERANDNAAKILGERDGFPREFKGKGRSKLFALLRRLQEDGAIIEETAMNASRHEVGAWRLTEKGRAELQTS